jgi:hypothetical protein
VIQVAPQMRILVAIDSVDLRKYALSIDMRSSFTTGLRNGSSALSGGTVPTRGAPHNVAFQAAVRTGSRERTTWTFLNFCRNPMI